MMVEIAVESASTLKNALDVNVFKLKGHIMLLVLYHLGLEMGSVTIQ